MELIEKYDLWDRDVLSGPDVRADWAQYLQTLEGSEMATVSEMDVDSVRRMVKASKTSVYGWLWNPQNPLMAFLGKDSVLWLREAVRNQEAWEVGTVYELLGFGVLAKRPLKRSRRITFRCFLLIWATCLARDLFLDQEGSRKPWSVLKRYETVALPSVLFKERDTLNMVSDGESGPQEPFSGVQSQEIGVYAKLVYLTFSRTKLSLLLEYQNPMLGEQFLSEGFKFQLFDRRARNLILRAVQCLGESPVPGLARSYLDRCESLKDPLRHYKDQVQGMTDPICAYRNATDVFRSYWSRAVDSDVTPFQACLIVAQLFPCDFHPLKEKGGFLSIWGPPTLEALYRAASTKACDAAFFQESTDILYLAATGGVPSDMDRTLFRCDRLDYRIRVLEPEKKHGFEQASGRARLTSDREVMIIKPWQTLDIDNQVQANHKMKVSTRSTLGLSTHSKALARFFDAPSGSKTEPVTRAFDMSLTYALTMLGKVSPELDQASRTKLTIFIWLFTNMQEVGKTLAGQIWSTLKGTLSRLIGTSDAQELNGLQVTLNLIEGFSGKLNGMQKETLNGLILKRCDDKRPKELNEPSDDRSSLDLLFALMACREPEGSCLQVALNLNGFDEKDEFLSLPSGTETLRTLGKGYAMTENVVSMVLGTQAKSYAVNLVVGAILAYTGADLYMQMLPAAPNLGPWTGILAQTAVVPVVTGLASMANRKFRSYKRYQ